MIETPQSTQNKKKVKYIKRVVGFIATIPFGFIARQLYKSFIKPHISEIKEMLSDHFNMLIICIIIVIITISLFILVGYCINKICITSSYNKTIDVIKMHGDDKFSIDINLDGKGPKAKIKTNDMEDSNQNNMNKNEEEKKVINIMPFMNK